MKDSNYLDQYLFKLDKFKAKENNRKISKIVPAIKENIGVYILLGITQITVGLIS